MGLGLGLVLGFGLELMLGFELARHSIIAPSSLCNGRHWIEPSKTTWSQTLDLSLYSLTFQVTTACMFLLQKHSAHLGIQKGSSACTTQS